MNKKNRKYYNVLLLFFVLLIFIMNYNHINQQGSYENIFKPIADNLLAGNGYTCSFFNNETLFYPIWGYTFLVFIDSIIGWNNLFIIGFQFFLCIISINVFYKIIDIEKKYWHIPFFLPFIALMSVKWPDAIVGALLVFFIFFLLHYFQTKRITSLLLTGIILGILVNFRSEYLYLPLSLILLFFVPSLNNNRLIILKSILFLVISAILFLLPWAIRSYHQVGEFRLTSSNGGAVMFISLGQLPNNPWHIAPYDKTAYDFAKSKGFNNPYSTNADKMFREEFLKSIEQYPFSYIKKVVHNFLSIFYRGVYTGEFANSFIGIRERMELDSAITSQSGFINKISYISKLKAKESVPLLIEKFIRALFMIILLLMILLIVYSLWKKSYKNFQYIFWIAIPVILYKFLIVSFIQYEYRHINAIYLLIFALFLLVIENEWGEKKILK